MQNWLEQLSELLKKDQTHLRALETLLEERISALVTQSFSEVFEAKIC